MSYKNLNKLKRIIEIQNLTIEHTQKGCTQKWVYDNIIFPRFYISLSTYYSYLGYNAKVELKKLATTNGK